MPRKVFSFHPQPHEFHDALLFYVFFRSLLFSFFFPLTVLAPGSPATVCKPAVRLLHLPRPGTPFWYAKKL